MEMENEFGNLLSVVDFDEELEFEEDADYPFEDVFGNGAGSGPPPWYGFPPRVVGVDLSKPFRPSLALWREGLFVDLATIDVGAFQPKNVPRSLLKLSQAFGDFCREKGLFGAHLATVNHYNDPRSIRAAVWTAIIAEADWAGLFIDQPLPLDEYPEGPKQIAALGARKLLNR